MPELVSFAWNEHPHTCPVVEALGGTISIEIATDHGRPSRTNVPVLEMSRPGSRRYWCGSYAEPGGEGIYLLERQGEGGTLRVVGLVAETTSPSFLAMHPKRRVLYAVLEEEVGQLEAFTVYESGELISLARAPSLGAYPCHLTVLPQTGAVAAANYGSGEVVVVPTDTRGALRARAAVSLAGQGHGPNTDRQDGPHAHAVMLAPDGHILAVDLGADLVRVFTEDASVPTLRLVSEVQLPPGGGPRHLAFGPRPFVYVLLELTSSVAVLRAGDSYAQLSFLDEFPAFVDPVPGGTLAAEIAYQPPTGVLYVSLRGPDRICVLGTEDDGRRLTILQEEPSGGRGPRHFCIDGEMMYIANEQSNDITTLRVRPSDGRLAPTGCGAPVPAPVCILPVPVSWP